MSEEIILGIDTSNYTTSVAAVSADGDIVCNIKLPLPVRSGECGLRQSDALFSHIKNIPEAMNRLGEAISGRKVTAVGVSISPRNQAGSYMPVFLAGKSAATSIAATLGVPMYTFSHQCGHIMAVIHSSNREDLLSKSFAAFHVSGGTTELVKVTPGIDGFSVEVIGGTKDINAGQLIDRIGVHLGLDFPAGPHLENLALDYQGKRKTVKIAGEGMYVNLSGIENKAVKLYDETGDKRFVASYVFDCVYSALARMADSYQNEYGATTFVFAGGVMSSKIIKDRLSASFDAVFATPALSSDNAVGIAELARRAHNR